MILLLGAAPTAGADTLAGVLRANGLSPPAGLPDLDRPIGNHVIAAERGPTIVLYDAGEPGGSARLVALRLGPSTVTRVPLVWPRSAPEGLDANTCARVDSVRRHAEFVVATAHVNPSAACTLVLGRDLALRGTPRITRIAGLLRVPTRSRPDRDGPWCPRRRAPGHLTRGGFRPILGRVAARVRHQRRHPEGAPRRKAL